MDACARTTLNKGKEKICQRTRMHDGCMSRTLVLLSSASTRHSVGRRREELLFLPLPATTPTKNSSFLPSSGWKVEKVRATLKPDCSYRTSREHTFECNNNPKSFVQWHVTILKAQSCLGPTRPNSRATIRLISQAAFSWEIALATKFHREKSSDGRELSGVTRGA